MNTQFELTLDEALSLAERLRHALSYGPAECRHAGLERDALALFEAADDLASRISNLANQLRS